MGCVSFLQESKVLNFERVLEPLGNPTLTIGDSLPYVQPFRGSGQAKLPGVAGVLGIVWEKRERKTKSQTKRQSWALTELYQLMTFTIKGLLNNSIGGDFPLLPASQSPRSRAPP